MYNYERVKRHRLSVLHEVANTITSEGEGEQTKDMEMYTEEKYLQLKDEVHSLKAEADSMQEEELLEQKYEIILDSSTAYHTISRCLEHSLQFSMMMHRPNSTQDCPYPTSLQFFSTFCTPLCTGITSLNLSMSSCLG